MYPFACDFYIKPLDLVIERNFRRTCGGRRYGPSDRSCVERLLEWRRRGGEFYRNAENALNYLEFWSMKQFKEWVSKNGD
jgi:hypothetical protein